MTMTLVSTITVGSGGAASIEWTDIPQTGTDLYVLFSLRSNRSANASGLNWTLNNSTSSYSYKRLEGRNTTVGNLSGSEQWPNSFNGDTSTSSTFGNGQAYIPNYTSTIGKTVSIESVAENNAVDAQVHILNGLWNVTSAITSIKLTESSGNSFLQYSTASLYKITKGSGGATVS